MKNALGVLGKKLLLYFVSISLIPATLLCCIHYLHGKKLLETELFNEMSLVGAALSEHINAFLVYGENSAKHYASDGFIREHLESINADTKNTAAAQALSKYLQYKTGLEPRFRETFTTNTKGIAVASSNALRVGTDMSQDLSALATKGGTFTKDVYLCDITGEYCLTLCSSVINKDTNEFLGMIGIRILAAELEGITVGAKQEASALLLPAHTPAAYSEEKTNIVPEKPYFNAQDADTSYKKNHTIRRPLELTTLTRRGETSEAYLVNKQRLMLTSSRFIDNVLLRQAVDTLPVNVLINEGREIAGIYEDYRGVPVLGVSKYIKPMGWILLVEADVAEAFKPVYMARNYSIVIIVASVFVISAVAFLISGRIVNPLKSLMAAMGKVSKGDIGNHIRVTSKDEIGELTKGFNRMTTDLIKARDELRDLFDAANDPMVTLKEGNMVNNMNSRVSELFGYTQKDLLSKKIVSIFRKEDVPIVEEALDSAWRLTPGEKYPMFEVGVMKKDGNALVCELDLNRTQFGIQPHFRNITKRKLLEQRILEEKQKLGESNTRLQSLVAELERTQMQLLQSEKMASLGQLAAGIAHEINNPVGYISSNLEWMQNKFVIIKTMLEELKKESKPQTRPWGNRKNIASQMEKSINESLEGTRRIQSIVNSLRIFSHRAEDKLEPANINTEIENALNIIRNEIKYKAKLIKSYGDIPPIHCNRRQLGQVFMNIILNAAQALKEMGEIRITTYRKDYSIFIVISDNGPGIPEQDLPKIFEPFFTTKEPGMGTGLGLSIAYNIIASHNGTIEVDSKVNRGTTFTVKLPVTV